MRSEGSVQNKHLSSHTACHFWMLHEMRPKPTVCNFAILSKHAALQSDVYFVARRTSSGRLWPGMFPNRHHTEMRLAIVGFSVSAAVDAVRLRRIQAIDDQVLGYVMWKLQLRCHGRGLQLSRISELSQWFRGFFVWGLAMPF